MRGSGRNFDFCYCSDVNTQLLNNIKGVMATEVSFISAQRHESDACKPL
jgi:hypothetical protein